MNAILTRRTVELCRIASVTGNEADCAERIAAILRDTPLAVSRVGNTILARTVARAGRPLVLLVGHTDTVPPKATDGGVRIEGDRLYGLGASDMKGGLAVMLELSRAVGDGRDLNVDLGFVFYDKEEGPWAESGLGPTLEQTPWLRRAELAFCLEPSDNVVQVGCLGTLHATVAFGGKAAHSARPWQGANAIHAAAPLLAALAARAPNDVVCDGHLFREVLSATLASGGNTRNVIPDRFSLNLNYRFAPGRSDESAMEEVRRFCAESCPLNPPDVSFVEVAPSGRVVLENRLLRRFLAENGNAVAAKQAWTDVARLSQAGIDAVNLGPGLAAQAHQADEYCSIDLLEASYRQFARFVGLSG
ncbi:succinyl-diaminopimelate desuccinylase [Deltaproteobacteria bacterium]|nr:succinyl-diaminopimelate desuccinylase [Deltaproteobacteria bacterium]